MFIRIKDTPNSPRKAIQIVESLREGKKVKQKILRHVGVAMNDEELERMKDLATYIMVQMKEEIQPSLFDVNELSEMVIASRKRAEMHDGPMEVKLQDLREEARLTVGFHEVYGDIFDQIGFNRVLGSRRQASGKALRDIVMARLARPLSKRGSSAMLRKDFAIESNVDQIYRMMDHIDDKVIEKIGDLSRDAASLMLGERMDVFFYDCTTLYFESFDEDDLRQKGFSKEHRSTETQVLLALLVTREGLPVGYRLYPGATWEGHTLQEAARDIARHVGINKIVVVADSGILSHANLAFLDSIEQPFVVGARLKNLPAKLSEEITNRDNYNALTDGGLVFETKLNGHRLIVTWSEQRACKDAHDREKLLARARKRYDGKSCRNLVKGKMASLLKIEGEGQVAIDEANVMEAAVWDGLHGVLTNDEALSVEDILEQYRGLWQVEETFRISKHDLRMRPMFHWTERRIRAHVAICFIALTCARNLQYQCAFRKARLSPEVIREELTHAQLSVLKHVKTGKRYAIPAKPGNHIQQLYSIVGKNYSATPFPII